MAKLSTEELLEQFQGSHLIAALGVYKTFEETFDVSAAAPVAVAAAPAAGGAAEAAEEKDEFDVVLESAGDKKIQVIKVVRDCTGLGLGEAKGLGRGKPQNVCSRARRKEDARAAKGKKLEEAGAGVKLAKVPSSRPYCSDAMFRSPLLQDDAEALRTASAGGLEHGRNDWRRMIRRRPAEHRTKIVVTTLCVLVAANRPDLGAIAGPGLVDRVYRAHDFGD
ncbi:hypothetical protein FQA39_LY18876 [Lamprigera yunnana]|nr:hypothetical protein FQA39_LY18876 [Lamprigera yunnana]